MINGNKKAVTLVEIIVSIVVLVILSSVAYVSFGNYIISARDWARIFEFENIQSALNTYNLKKGHYPEPSNAVDVTYLWWLVWSQWTFWNSIADLIGYTEDVKDPLTGSFYTYSLKNSKKAFSLAWVLEKQLNHQAFNWITSEVNASSIWTKEGTAIVLWNYNWEIISVNISGSSKVLALPSIVASNLVSTDLNDILDNNRLVIHGYENLPASYDNTVFNLDANVDYLLWDLVLYEWNVNNFAIWYVQVILLRGMYEAYSWSVLWNSISVNRIPYSDLSQLVYSNEIQGIACDTVNKKLKFNTDCDPIDIMTLYILNMLTIDLSNLPGNLSNAFVDSNGNYVIWTSGGFAIYDWENWTIFSTQNSDLIHNSIYSILEDNVWYYWIWTNNWISRYDEDAVDPNPVWITYQTELVSTAVRVLFNDHSLWAPEPDIVRIWTNGWVNSFNVATEEWTSLEYEDGLTSEAISSVLVASDWIKWFWTDTKWVDKYDSDLDIIVNYDDTSWLPNKVVNVIYEDMQWRIWVWTNGWLWVTSDNWDTWSIITEANWLVDNAITTIFDNTKDGQYSLWFWTTDWMSRYHNWNWTTYDTSQPSIHLLTGDEIYSIYYATSWAIAVLTDWSLTTIEPATGEVLYPVE